MIAQAYQLHARQGADVSVATALKELSTWLASQAGNLGARSLQDQTDKCQFLFLEFWQTPQARAAAANHMPKEVMSALMDALNQKPIVLSYDVIE